MHPPRPSYAGPSASITPLLPSTCPKCGHRRELRPYRIKRDGGRSLRWHCRHCRKLHSRRTRRRNRVSTIRRAADIRASPVLVASLLEPLIRRTSGDSVAEDVLSLGTDRAARIAVKLAEYLDGWRQADIEAQQRKQTERSAATRSVAILAAAEQVLRDAGYSVSAPGASERPSPP